MAADLAGNRRRRGAQAEHARHRRPGRQRLLARQPRRFRDPRWTSKLPETWRPDVRADRHRPGPKTTWDQVVTLAKLYRTALDHLERAGVSQGHRPPRHPGVDPDRGEVRLPRHERLGGAVSRAVGAHRARPRVAGNGRSGNRQGLARLDYTQNASIKTLVAPYSVRPAPARRCRPRSPGTSWTTPTCGRTAGRSGRSSTASPSAATCSQAP